MRNQQGTKFFHLTICWVNFLFLLWFIKQYPFFMAKYLIQTKEDGHLIAMSWRQWAVYPLQNPKIIPGYVSCILSKLSMAPIFSYLSVSYHTVAAMLGVSEVYGCKGIVGNTLTQWPLGDAAVIWKTLLSNSSCRLSWVFHWKLLSCWMPQNPLTKSIKKSMQHWFRWWLGATKQEAVTWVSVDQDLRHHKMSPGHN